MNGYQHHWLTELFFPALARTWYAKWSYCTMVVSTMGFRLVEVISWAPGPQLYETDPVDDVAWRTLGMILTMHTRFSQSGSDTELIQTAVVSLQEMV